MPYFPKGERSDEQGAVTKLRLIEEDLNLFWDQVKKKQPGATTGETEDIKITFDFRFVNDASLNWGTIGILGLRPKTAQKFKMGRHIELSAGWKWDTPDNWLKFSATVEDVKYEQEDDTTWGVKMMIYDASELWMGQPVFEAYRPGIKASKVWLDLVERYLPDMDIRSYKPKRDVTYRRGRMFGGTPLRWVLDDVAKDMASRTFLWNSGIYLHGPGRGWQSDVLLDQDHGLQRVQRVSASGERMPVTEDEYALRYEANAFLQPKLGPDAIIDLQSKYVKGPFRLVAGRHTSDGQRWQTKDMVLTHNEDLSEVPLQGFSTETHQRQQGKRASTILGREAV